MLFVVQVGGASHAGGLAMHWFDEEQILLASPQSASLVHCTHEPPPVVFVLQMPVGAAQSVACVAVVQTGLHRLLAHL